MLNSFKQKKNRRLPRVLSAVLIVAVLQACSAQATSPAAYQAGGVALTQEAADELTAVAYGLYRVLPKGTYDDVEMMRSMVTRGGDAFGTFLAYVYHGRAGETYDTGNGDVSVTAADIDADAVQELVTSLFGAPADFSVLPQIIGVAPAGACYREDTLTVYMMPSTGSITHEHADVTEHEDGADFTVQIIKEGAEAGTVHLFLKPAKNKYGAEIAGCEME